MGFVAVQRDFWELFPEVRCIFAVMFYGCVMDLGLRKAFGYCEVR